MFVNGSGFDCMKKAACRHCNGLGWIVNPNGWANAVAAMGQLHANGTKNGWDALVVIHGKVGTSGQWRGETIATYEEARDLAILRAVERLPGVEFPAEADVKPQTAQAHRTPTVSPSRPSNPR